MLTPESINMYQYLPEPHATLLKGIILGVDIRHAKGLYEQFQRAGLLHIVVLSGMNITMLARYISRLTNFLPRRLSALISCIAIMLFVIFVGLEPPVVRAAIMGTLGLLGGMFDRKAIPVYSLLLSAFFIAIINFEWVTSVSFQLSFFATLGVILVQKKEERNKNPSLFMKIYRYVASDVKTSLGAQFFTAPILFYYFRSFALLSILANILISFTIGPLMTVGFVMIALGALSKSLVYPLSIFIYGILTYVLFIVEKISLISWAYVEF